MREIEHAGVKRRGLDVVHFPVLLADEPALVFAVVIQPPVADEVGVDVAEEAHAARVQFLDRLTEVRIELLVDLPVPPDLLAHHGAFFARPVLRPDGRDLRPGVEHGEGLAQNRLRAALHAEDHALEAPVRQILPVRDVRRERAAEFGEILAREEREPLGAAVEEEAKFVPRGEVRRAVRGGVEQNQPVPVGHIDRHGRVAPDGGMGFLPIERAWQQRLFDDGRGLDVLGDEVHHALAAVVHLAVLLAAAEDGFVLFGREAEFVAPAVLALEGEIHAERRFFYRDAEAVPAAGEDDGIALLLHRRERDALGLADGGFDRAAVRGIGLLLPDGGRKGAILAVAQQDVFPPAQHQHIRFGHGHSSR